MGNLYEHAVANQFVSICFRKSFWWPTACMLFVGGPWKRIGGAVGGVAALGGLGAGGDLPGLATVRCDG